MLCLPILIDEIKTAELEAKAMGALNRSILKGNGNVAGILGELAVLRYFGYLNARRNNTYNHDLIIKGFRFDVKTKRRKVDPQPHHCGTIPSYSDQSCHAYIFTSVCYVGDNPSHVHLCGWVGKDRFKKEAINYKKGDVNPENGWVCSMDCYCMDYSKMKSITSLECGLLFSDK